MSYSILEKASYTLYLNSNDKVSGNNNNATYEVHWNDFLPERYDCYKVIFSMQTSGGYYKDVNPNIYSTGKVVFNFGGKSFSYDTSTKSESLTLGYITRDPQATTTSSNILSCFYCQNAPKIINRCTTNLFTIQVFNTQTNPNVLLVNTDMSGNALADMTSYTMLIEFLPIESSARLGKLDM
jgi:hypothetical protein